MNIFEYAKEMADKWQRFFVSAITRVEYDKDSDGLYLIDQHGYMLTKTDIEEMYQKCMVFFDHHGHDIGEVVNAEKDARQKQKEETEQRQRIEASFQRRAAKRLEHNPGYVYLISNGSQCYKIGRSKNPAKRLNTLSGGNPAWSLLHSISCHNMITAEQDLHDRFFDKRQEGEWFALTSEDVQSIKSIECM